MKNFITSFLIFLIFLFLGASLAVIFFSQQEKKVSSLLSPVLAPPPSSQQETSPSSLNFSLENSPSNAIRGLITELNGSVMWKSRTATESANLSLSTPIQQGEEIETMDGGNLILEFGNERFIHILPNSGLNIIQTMPSNLVFQHTDGTVIFKNSSGLPLAIRSLSLITQFDNGEAIIIVNKKTSIVSVEATKGSLISAYNDLKYVTRVVNIAQGKKLTFNNVKKKATIK